MSDPATPTVNLISGDGVAPDNDTLGVDAGTGKLKIVRVPGDALPSEILGEGLELKDAKFALQIDPTPDDLEYTGLETTVNGVRIKGDSNGIGRRFIGQDHTEVEAPLPGDVYYEIGAEV